MVGLSFLACAITIVAIARSFVVQDVVTWSKITEEPMTAQAYAHARQKGFEGNFIALYRVRAATLLRGIVVVRLFRSENVMSRWEPAYAEQNRNKPRWRWQHRPADGAARPLQRRGVLGRLGFGMQEIPAGVFAWKASARDVNVPLWPIALVTAILPASWLGRALRRWHRRRRGRCVVCGYDRRGIEDRRCPECGMLPVAATIEG